jgi:hypothetical protein
VYTSTSVMSLIMYIGISVSQSNWPLMSHYTKLCTRLLIFCSINLISFDFDLVSLYIYIIYSLYSLVEGFPCTPNMYLSTLLLCKPEDVY